MAIQSAQPDQPFLASDYPHHRTTRVKLRVCKAAHFIPHNFCPIAQHALRLPLDQATRAPHASSLFIPSLHAPWSSFAAADLTQLPIAIWSLVAATSIRSLSIAYPDTVISTMADTTATIPEAAAAAATEQTANVTTEPAAAPTGGAAADESKPTADAPKENAEKSEGEFDCYYASRSASRFLGRRGNRYRSEAQHQLVAQRTRCITNAR